MPTRIQIAALVAIILLTAALIGWWQEQRWTWSNLAATGTASLVAGLFIGLFNQWIWKFPVLQGWFVRRPRLYGPWIATLQSQWRGGDGEKLAPIEAQVTILQTYWSLHIRLETAESQGELICGQIIERADGTFQIAAIFRNEPRISLKSVSRPHIGALLLDVIGDPNMPRELRGQYWTDRETFGEFFAVRPRLN